jgi:long-subunit acyl-CoA synthetase (AMP-forming)
MLTNTQKMRRNEIKKKFKVEIDKMYFEVQS